MEDYNKIIESLGVRYIKSRNIKIAKQVTIDNFYDLENAIILVNNGDIYYGPDKEKVTEGDMLFIPGGKSLSISFGSLSAPTISNEDFISIRRNTFRMRQILKQTTLMWIALAKLCLRLKSSIR